MPMAAVKEGVVITAEAQIMGLIFPLEKDATWRMLDEDETARLKALRECLAIVQEEARIRDELDGEITRQMNEDEPIGKKHAEEFQENQHIETPQKEKKNAQARKRGTGRRRGRPRRT